MLVTHIVSAQPETDIPSVFPIGEKLTYSISLEKIPDIAYAEMHVVSAGKLADKDAVELRFRVKTRDVASAAFYMVDETRTTIVSAMSGLPLIIRRSGLIDGVPGEVSLDLTSSQTGNFDLASVIYAIRRGGISGTVMLEENGRPYSVSYKIKGKTGRAKVTTPAGEFETTTYIVESSFLTDLGIEQFEMNIADDVLRTPVRYGFRTDKGRFNGILTSKQIIIPEPAATPTPAPSQTPAPTPSPTPIPTPTPYIKNQPLPKDLAFLLGEKLVYNISTKGNAVGKLTLWAQERSEFQGRDSLLLTAEVTEVSASTVGFSVADRFSVRVDPLTLSPQLSEVKLSGNLAWMNQTALFDPVSSRITIGTNRLEAPFGTHTPLSLLYAMRSFNLRPSRTLSNPVNDTRVAVLWGSTTSVFSLRPSDVELKDVKGESVEAQLVNVITGNPQLDGLTPKVWLSNDESRIPLRFTIGTYQFDLAGNSIEVAPDKAASSSDR